MRPHTWQRETGRRKCIRLTPAAPAIICSEIRFSEIERRRTPARAASARFRQRPDTASLRQVAGLAQPSQLCEQYRMQRIRVEALQRFRPPGAAEGRREQTVRAVNPSHPDEAGCAVRRPAKYPAESIPIGRSSCASASDARRSDLIPLRPLRWGSGGSREIPKVPGVSAHFGVGAPTGHVGASNSRFGKRDGCPHNPEGRKRKHQPGARGRWQKPEKIRAKGH